MLSLVSILEKVKNKTRVIAAFFLSGYVMFVLYKIVFSRLERETYMYDLHPFWSYSAIINGKVNLIEEHYLNIALFIPFGFLLWFVLKQKQWWKAMMLGCTFSISIEAMQLFMKKGFCEFDDVFHNTLGCLIGYVIAGVIMRICIKIIPT